MTATKPPKAWRERFKRPGQRDAYKIRWRETDPTTGKTVKRSSELIHSAADAAAELDTRNAALSKIWQQSRPQAGSSATLTLSDTFRRWKESRLASGEIREGYATEAEQCWERVCKQAQWTRLADITGESIDTWIVSRKGVGVAKSHLVIRSILHFAATRLKQPIDPDALAVPPIRRVERSQPPLLTDDQVAQIRYRARQYGIQVSTIIDHLATFGCRPIDACRCTIARWQSDQRLIVRHAGDTKNKRPVVHPVPAAHARDLDTLAQGRSAEDPLFLHPSGRPWRLNKIGGAGELVDWYWNNISSQIPNLLPEQRGIYCLKDYAITRMITSGLDVRTITTFTGIMTLSVYQRYHATNRTRQQHAIDTIPDLPTSAAG
jgi:integrase